MLTSMSAGHRWRIAGVAREGADNATLAQVALAWQLRRTPVSLPIPGTTSVAHLMENLAAQSIDLTENEFASITAISPEA